MQQIIGFLLIFMAVMYSLNKTADEIQFECEWIVHVQWHHTRMTVKQLSKNGCVFNETNAVSVEHGKPIDSYGVKYYSLRSWQLKHVSG